MSGVRVGIDEWVRVVVGKMSGVEVGGDRCSGVE